MAKIKIKCPNPQCTLKTFEWEAPPNDHGTRALDADGTVYYIKCPNPACKAPIEVVS